MVTHDLNLLNNIIHKEIYYIYQDSSCVELQLKSTYPIITVCGKSLISVSL